jgi:hypothetical protein
MSPRRARVRQEHYRPSAETLVRDARVCQGRQGRLLFPKCAEVQHEVRNVWLQRQREPRRRCHVADRLRADRRGKDRRACKKKRNEISRRFSRMNTDPICVNPRKPLGGD